MNCKPVVRHKGSLFKGMDGFFAESGSFVDFAFVASGQFASLCSKRPIRVD